MLLKKRTPNSVFPVNHYSAHAWQNRQRVLTVMTYNVKNCDNGKKIAEIAEDIQKYNPDAVCVQEIDQGVRRSGQKDILKELADTLQMNYCFFPTIRLQGGAYGLGILSVYPLENCTLQPLEVRKGDEKRILAHAMITVHNQPIHIYNTHLSFEDTQLRLQQIKAVHTQIYKSTPFVLTGDFNVESLQELSDFSDAYAANTEEVPYQTFIGDEGGFRAIDNIIVSKDLNIKEVILGNTAVSDHRPLIAAICF